MKNSITKDFIISIVICILLIAVTFIPGVVK